MIQPRFTFSQLETSEDSCMCGQRAAFRITRASLNVDDKLCGICAIAYLLQFFKNEGVELAPILEVFPKASAALEAPVSNFVM